MRIYTNGEKALLMLSVLPGGAPRVTEARYRKLLQAALALGPGRGDRNRELEEGDLRRLGCQEAEAREILSRLERQEELDRFLRNLEAKHIQLITRLSPEYPERLRQRLGDRAPLALFCVGNMELFSRDCVSLVGSRRLREKGRTFARRAGSAIARQGFCYCSGGAAGADTEGFLGADREKGSAVLFLADSLKKHRYDRRYFSALKEGRLLLVSEFGADQSFSNFRALSRNRLIHAMGEKVLVAQSDHGTGGTWNGTVENLKAGWSPVFVYQGLGEDPGAQGLLGLGAEPVSMEALSQLEALSGSQLHL